MLSRYFDDSYWERADRQLQELREQARDPDLSMALQDEFHDYVGAAHTVKVLNFIRDYGLWPLPLFVQNSPLEFLRVRLQWRAAVIRGESWVENWRVESRIREQDGDEFLLYVLTEYIEGRQTLDALMQAAQLRARLRGAE